MPCLSSRADSVLNESIRVSNAESQLALPLAMTTVFGSSVICSPNGSAVCTGAAAGGDGVCAVEGRCAGDLVSAGGGTGVAVAAGAGDAAGAGVVAAGGAAGGGDCASAPPRPNEIAAAGTSATRARRKQRVKFIQYSPEAYPALAPRPACPGFTSAKRATIQCYVNTQGRLSSHDR